MTCKYCEDTGVVAVDYRCGYALERCGCGCIPNDFIEEFYWIDNKILEENFAGLTSQAREYVEDSQKLKRMPSLFMCENFKLISHELIELSPDIKAKGIMQTFQNESGSINIILKEEIQNKEREVGLDQPILTFLKMLVIDNINTVTIEYDLFCWTRVPENSYTIDSKCGTYWY